MEVVGEYGFRRVLGRGVFWVDGFAVAGSGVGAGVWPAGGIEVCGGVADVFVGRMGGGIVYREPIWRCPRFVWGAGLVGGGQ